MADYGKPTANEMGNQKAPARRFPNGTKSSEETTTDRKKKKYNFYMSNKQKYEEENKSG